MSTAVSYALHRWLGPAACALLASLPGAQMSAHELPQTTATLTLRSGHLEVRMNVDLVAWLARVDEAAGGDAGPLGVAQMAQADPGALESLRERARHELAERLTVRIDGKAVTLDAVRFPSASVTRAVAARALVAATVEAQRLDVHPDAHHRAEVLPIVAELRLPAAPRAIDVRFPASLGPVSAQLIEPQVQQVAAGGAAVFRPAARSAPSPLPPTRTAPQPR